MKKYFSLVMLVLLYTYCSICFSLDNKTNIASPARLKDLLNLPSDAHTLDLTNLDVANDEVAIYSSSDISVSMLIEMAKRMDEEDRLRIKAVIFRVSLLHNSGFKTFAEGFLPLFSSLEYLDLSFDGIEPEDKNVLYIVLAKYPNFKYININQNPLAKAVCNDVSNEMENADRERVIRKVIVSSLVMLDSLPLNFPEWGKTHEEFYKQMR
jgi:hypothetical protein